MAASKAAGQAPAGSVTIHAPNPAFDGVVAGVAFAKGKATADRKADAAAIGYFRRRGYGIGAAAPKPEPEPEPAVSAIEAAAVESVGGRLRDAAVDPHPDDFLPPVNAGKADPHGPKVVAPEIHHDGPAGLRPGVVAVDDPKRQTREEQAAAKAVLIEGRDKGEALGTFAPGDDTGDLGLSDPGSADAGRDPEAIAERVADRGVVIGATERPTKSAKVDAWRDFAVTQGMDPDEAGAATKAELIERYGGEG